jgi:RimJ/RimL family protein N-acetyltransferase
MTIRLETPRLILREFVPADLDDFYRLVTDPDVIRYTGDPGGSREEVRQGMEARVFTDYRVRGFGRWAAILKEEDRFIGFAGLKYLEDVGGVDVGYRFFKDYWGRGLATEACRALVGHGFDELQLPRILGLVDPDNAASIHVLEKCGFRFEKFAPYRGSHTAWYVIDRPPVQ